MGKTRHNKRQYIRYAIIALLVVFLLSTALFLVNIWENQNNKYHGTDAGETFVEYEGKQYVLSENVETLLVMGLDKWEEDVETDSYNNDQQADFIMLLVFDNESKKCTAININRDTITDVNVLGVNGNKINTVKQQIAFSHTYGNGENVSCRNVSDSVSVLLNNIKVNHYISLTMDAVSILNDLVGGVSVVVEDDFSGIDESLKQGETITLTGKQALSFVRTRQGLEDSSNIARIERQKQYMTALYEKVQEKMETDNEFVLNASLELGDYIVSDRSATQLEAILEKFNLYEFTEIKDIKGESKKGEKYMEFHPAKDSIDEIVFDLFYEPKT